MILQIPYHQFRTWAMLFGIGVRRYLIASATVTEKPQSTENAYRGLSGIARPEFIFYPD
jgi:hypothetical protein